jgi:hypothetical protein
VGEGGAIHSPLFDKIDAYVALFPTNNLNPSFSQIIENVN